MKVRFLIGMAGPGVSRVRGDVAEVDDAEAARLFAAGYAEPAEAKPPEPARGGPRERAVSRAAAQREKAVETE